MVQMSPEIRDQLKKLKKIPFSSIKNASAGVIELRIRDLSWKDTARALYVATSAFAELSHKQQVISKIIHKSQEDIKLVLENKDLTREEIIEKIKEIVLDPIGDEHPEESSP
jgi:hypothetical protein